MRKLSIFNSVTADGYFVGPDGDMSWAHKQDVEWTSFVADNAKGECEMLFGRVTYQMMAGWWPTPQAIKSMPAVAEKMNSAPKFVFSRTLTEVSWKNAKLVNGDLAVEVQKMKEAPGPDMIIFGSGTIVSQLTQAGLIDEYQIVLNPVVLGGGRTMFDGVKKPLNLRLTSTRSFANGNVFLTYEPVAR